MRGSCRGQASNSVGNIIAMQLFGPEIIIVADANNIDLCGYVHKLQRPAGSQCDDRTASVQYVC